jgi:hypothetical protein
MNNLFFSLILLIFSAIVQLISAAEYPSLKKFTAVRIDETVEIDGILSEQIWQTAPGYTNFVQQDPNNGEPASLRSEVWIAYDKDAIYFGGRFYDPYPDSIMARLVRRDFIWGDPSDGCVLYFDPYNDKRSGYFFYVSSAGTLADGLIYNDVKQPNDLSWDAVWEGAANLDSEGWTAEMRIPYSQLRFKEEEMQIWGINVERFISRRVETDMISHTPRNESGFASRFTELIGIKGIKPVSRIEVLPYITGKAEYTRRDPGNPFNSGNKYTPNMGLDVRTGLSNSLTLNATINPDFGQVEVDPAIVNLSDVESSFQEKRPFFTEGVTVYNFGNGGLTNSSSFNWYSPNMVYSRRIGRHPQGGLSAYDYAEVPEGTRILGAVKISGQVLDDWKLGTIHAVTNREYAILQTDGQRSEVEVEPLTYYGVFRTQKDFNQGAQGFGILSTYVNRFFKDKSLNNNINGSAIVAAADGYTFLDSDRTYVLSGWGSITNVTGTNQRMISLQRNSGHYFQRPDASHLKVDSSITSMTGYAGRLHFNKNRGRFVFNSAVGFISPKFEVNDLGYNPFTDLINMHFLASYRWNEPTSYYLSTGMSAATYASYDFGGTKTNQGYYLGTYFTHTSHNGINLNLQYYPASYNTRRTRGGPLTINPVSRSFNVYVFSDFRKDWVMQVGTNGRYGEDLRNITYWGNIELKLAPTLTLARRARYTKKYLRNTVGDIICRCRSIRYIQQKICFCTA